MRFVRLSLICALISAVYVLLSGCATTGRFHEHLREYINAGRYSTAATFIENSRDEIYGARDELIYYLDLAYILHLEGEFEKSNFYFERAKRISQDHFTKSITAEASTFLISDNMRPYYGEDFERVLIHAFSALNHIMLGDYSSALVEARQSDHLLGTLRLTRGYESAYSEDAFSRYLMGIIYEAAGEINNAFISYRRALNAYEEYSKNYGMRIPSSVINDTYRTARRLGFSEEAEYISKKHGISVAEKQNPKRKGVGEAIVLIYVGASPHKIDSFFEISFGRAWLYVGKMETKNQDVGEVEKARRLARSIAAEHQIVMAFPKYVDSNYLTKNIFCEVIDSYGNVVFSGGEFELVQDIGEIAANTLRERIGAIRNRTIARAAIKFVLSGQVSRAVARESGDNRLGWFVKRILSAASAATELADKRSWRTLPDKIYLARISLVEGNYDLRFAFSDASGRFVASDVLEDVKIIEDRKTFRVLGVSK